MLVSGAKPKSLTVIEKQINFSYHVWLIAYDKNFSASGASALTISIQPDLISLLYWRCNDHSHLITQSQQLDCRLLINCCNWGLGRKKSDPTHQI